MGNSTRGILIFSRYNSKRLPGKALLPLGDDSLLGCVINQCKNIHGTLVVATSNECSDDPIVAFAAARGVEVFRGSLNNVAERTSCCLEKYGFSEFARINGDSPFVPFAYINQAFNLFPRYELVTNIFPRTFPYGMSVEVMSSKLFMNSYKEFSAQEEEHITSYFYRNIERYNYYNIISDVILPEKIQLTVDDQRSYLVIHKMFMEDPQIQSKSLCKIIEAWLRCSSDASFG